MSAALAAKVAAPASDRATLSAVYAGMARDWADAGPTPAALAATAGYYSSEGTPTPHPLPYAAFAPPLAPGAVRLLAFFLLPRGGGGGGDGGGPALAAAAIAAGDAVAAALPPGARLHRSPAPGLHLTLFMTSQPFALCPDPFEAAGEGGGVEGGAAAEEEDGGALPPLLGAPRPGVVAREVGAAVALVSSAGAGAGRGPTFQAHSVVLAPSGALLLLLTEVVEDKGRHGVAAALRAAARAAFPRAPPSQPTIFHVTLGRLLSPLGPGDGPAIAAVAEAAKTASETVRGMRWSPPALSHICEEVFATVAGPRTDVEFRERA